MRIAVISDIHGNMDALESVLRDIDNIGVDRIRCLGDSIGYGAEPSEVIGALRQRDIASVVGNHELAVAQRRFLSRFNPTARASLVKTAEMLTAADHRYIAALPAALVRDGARLVHGFPPDSPLTYLFQVSDKKMKQCFEALAEPVCFVGHTHELEIVSCDGGRIIRERLEECRRPLATDRRYIVNIGSVGQPRDGDNRAKYAIWYPDHHSLEIRFVGYDVDAAAEKILKAGLPRAHALRLR